MKSYQGKNPNACDKGCEKQMVTYRNQKNRMGFNF